MARAPAHTHVHDTNNLLFCHTMADNNQPNEWPAQRGHESLAAAQAAPPPTKAKSEAAPAAQAKANWPTMAEAGLPDTASTVLLQQTAPQERALPGWVARAGKAPPTKFISILRKQNMDFMSEGHARGRQPSGSEAANWLGRASSTTEADLNSLAVPAPHFTKAALAAAPPPAKALPTPPATPCLSGLPETILTAGDATRAISEASPHTTQASMIVHAPLRQQPYAQSEPSAPGTTTSIGFSVVGTEEVLYQAPARTGPLIADSGWEQPASEAPSNFTTPQHTTTSVAASGAPSMSVSAAPAWAPTAIREAPEAEDATTTYSGFDTRTEVFVETRFPRLSEDEPAYVQDLGPTQPHAPLLTPATHARLQHAEVLAAQTRTFWRANADNSGATLYVKMQRATGEIQGATLIRFASWPAFVGARTGSREVGYMPWTVIPHTRHPWTGIYHECPLDLQIYLDTHGIWLAFKDADAPAWLLNQTWEEGAPHPLASRPLGSTVPFESAYPDIPRDHFPLPTVEPDELARWSALNRMGKPPAGIYGWVLAEDAPRNTDGQRIHHRNLGVYHPLLARDKPAQPRENAAICRQFTRRGNCPRGAKCEHRHEPLDLPGAICKHYLRGETCRRDENADPRDNPCDRIHGLLLTDPTGRDLLCPQLGEGEYRPCLRIQPDTPPDMLTDSPRPPEVTFRERRDATLPLWLPVPCPETFNLYLYRMTDSLYGVTPHPPNWMRTARPTLGEPISEALEHAIVTLSEIRYLPPEVTLSIYDTHLEPMLRNLPAMVGEYNQDLNTWVRDPADHHGGHWLSDGQRPTARELRRRMEHLRDSLLEKLHEERRHIARAIENLR